MDRREIAFDPSILSLIADQRQMRDEPVTLGQVSKSGTYRLWRHAKDLVEEFLTGRQLQVVTLFLNGKSFSEIARTLRISKGSVDKHYRRAVKTLKKCLTIGVNK
jgi:DNA-binding NarL/FixJ family response regulator